MIDKFRKFLIIALILIFFASNSNSQNDKIRPSLNASVSQTIGLDTKIDINYSRPGVKGRKIWGDLVPFGLTPGNKYSDDKPFPWRAGANENTTFETSKDILIDGKKLPVGKYGIHMIPGEKEWIVIFSKNNSLWGSYKYNEAEDALRITVAPKEAPFEEWLTYGFDNLNGTSATAFLHWEKLIIPFQVSIVE
ncbi:MAG: DUF2911 domain-containing protein [Ignavibacteriales bacterium]|jgi:hypothetical protein|nr:DUF2911 domain-containing protein [Ignavibacteriales bacterium]MBK7978972.1 DUF2911 domain-containing protein [Ignavibacteriota bacterium]